MSRVYLTNPGGLLIAGNPPKSRKKSGKTMAKKRRSAAQKAATKKMLAANRAKRKGKSRARRARRPVGAVVVVRKSRPKRGKRSVAAKVARRAKRRARRAVKVATVTTVRGNPKKKVYRKRKGSRARRRARRNPAMEIGFLDGFTQINKNWQAVSKNGIMGWVALAGGGIGGVFAGTLLKSLTTPIASNVMPAMFTNPLFMRAWGAANAYLGGFLLARFMPGLDDKTKRAVLLGATAGAVMELVKPGMVADATAKLPVVGPLFAASQVKVEGLGDYVRLALNGMGAYTSTRTAGLPNRRSERLKPGNSINGPVYSASQGGRQISLQGRANSNRYDPSVVDGDNGLGCTFADQVVSVAADDGTAS